MIEWPEWWAWEIEFTSHLLKRMVDRRFNESDIRTRLDDATGFHRNHEDGRWVIETRHLEKRWHIIVEPLANENLLLVITAFPVD